MRSAMGIRPVPSSPVGTFVYADSCSNAFTFVAGATSVGTGSGSRGSLGDLKIVPGLVVMLAANAVSTETVRGPPAADRHPHFLRKT